MAKPELELGIPDDNANDLSRIMPPGEGNQDSVWYSHRISWYPGKTDFWHDKTQWLFLTKGVINIYFNISDYRGGYKKLKL